MRIRKHLFIASVCLGIIVPTLVLPIAYCISYAYLKTGSLELAPGLYLRASSAIESAKAVEIGDSARRAYKFVQERFGQSFRGELIVDARSSEEWAALGDNGEFTLGYYEAEHFSSFRLHSVCVPETVSEETIRHEMTHALIRELGDIRTLIDEGAAHYSETDDGFNLRMAASLLSSYPLDKARTEFCRNGKTEIYDPLLLETESARATGWLMVRRFYNLGYPLSRIVAMKRSELPSPQELVAEMPELALRFAAHTTTECELTNPKCWINYYWKLRSKYSTEASRKYSAELIRHTGYVADPEYIKCHAWLLATEAERRGESPTAYFAKISPAQFFSDCEHSYDALRNREKEFVLRLGAQLVQERGFLDQYAKDIETSSARENPEEVDALLDILHKYSDGKDASLHPVETSCWAFAYFHLSKGMAMKDFLALKGPLELTPKMLSEIESMPKLSPNIKASSEESSRADPEKELRRLRYLEERYQERLLHWLNVVD